MGYSQSKKTTDIEKRLQRIKLQLYGKEGAGGGIRHQLVNIPKEQQQTTTPTRVPSFSFEYVQKDLVKIGALATLAIGAQITLYFLLRSNVLRM